MKAYDHLLKSHLETFPRAYALSAKQKAAYRAHQSQYWAALKGALQSAWTRWIAPSMCDRVTQGKRQQSRACLAN